MPEFDKVQKTNEQRTSITGSKRSIRKGKGRYDLISPIAMRRLAVHYENGAEIHEERNWEKGQYVGWYIDSAIRHLFDFLCGKVDEDHLAAAMWNAGAAIHTQEKILKGELPMELWDLPFPIGEDNES